MGRATRDFAEQQRFFADSIFSTNAESSGSVVQQEPPEYASPRRNRWSEDLCRRVLVQECSDVPRNFNYADGVQFVYAKLVEWLGDENLDLSIGVLYEFIEVDCDYTHDEGAAFKRWQHDHLLRKDDLGNSYIPRMPYIVVGNPKPTEHLVQWRERHPERYRKVVVDPPSRSETVPYAPYLGIGSRNRYQLENSWFVSSKSGGTQVLPSGSKAEHHKKVWDPKYGTGGTFVRTREIRPQDYIGHFGYVESIELMDPFSDRTNRGNMSSPLHTAVSISTLHPKASFTTLGGRGTQGAIPLNERITELSSCQKWNLSPERFIVSASKQSMKCQCGTTACSKHPCKVSEGGDAAKGLPDQETVQGKAYYSNIKNVPLPNGVRIPNGVFVRKHELVPKDTQHLPESLHIGRMQSAEDLAVTRGLQSLGQEGSVQASGPLTPQIFKDRGLDFKWVVEGSSSHPLASLGDGSHSPCSTQGDDRFWRSISPSYSLRTDENQQCDSYDACCHSEISTDDCDSPTPSPHAENNSSINNEQFMIRKTGSHKNSVVIEGEQDHNLLELLKCKKLEAGSVIVEDRTYITLTKRSAHDKDSDKNYLSMFGQGYFREWVLRESINLTRLRVASVFDILLHNLRRNNNVNEETSSTLHTTSSALARSLHGIRKFFSKRTTGNLIKIITSGKHSHPQLEAARPSAKMQDKGNPNQGPLLVPQTSPSRVIQFHSQEVTSRPSANNTQAYVTMTTSARRRPVVDLNRELPPLPVLTPIQPFHIRKSSDHRVQPERRHGKWTEEEIEYSIGRLPMSTYDAPRDSSKYGGVHYFNDSRGKTFIPPPHVSSKSRPSLVHPALPISRISSQVAALSVAPTIAGFGTPSLTAGNSVGDTSPSAIKGFRPTMHPIFDPQTTLTEKVFVAVSNHGGLAKTNCSSSDLSIYSSAGADGLQPGDGDDYPGESDGREPKTKRSSVIGRAGFYDGLSTDSGSANTVRDTVLDPAKEYKELIARSVASTDSEANDPVAKYSTTSELTSNEMSVRNLYGLESPACVEQPHLQSAFGLKERKMLPMGFGVGGPSYERPIPGLELASGELVSKKRSTNPREFEPETPLNMILGSNSLGAAKPTLANSVSVTKYNSRSYPESVLSDSTPDAPADKTSTRLTAWTDIQEMSGLVDMLEERHTDSSKSRGEMKKLQGKTGEQKEIYEVELTRDMTEGENEPKQKFRDLLDKGALQSRKIGHRRNAHSESNGRFKGKRPELVQSDLTHKSISGLIEENEFPSFHSLAGDSNVSETSHHDSKSSNSIDKWSPRHQHSHSSSPTRSRNFLASKQLEYVSGKDELDPEVLRHCPNRPRPPMKKMFGEGGLLGDSFDLTLDQNSRSRRPGLMDKIKTKIEGFAAKTDISSLARNDNVKPRGATTFRISLREDEQATVYSQIELLVCVTANRFLMEQYTQGRMLADSLKKATDFWQNKGRAQVVEFKYDQLTQRDLIIANQKNFRFHGENANNPLHINATLYTWKQGAKEMSIRTFCSSDSMIEKHLIDCYKILDMLGAHPAQFLALREVHQYFRGKVSRARTKEMMKMKSIGIEQVSPPISPPFPVGHAHEVAWVPVPDDPPEVLCDPRKSM